MVAAIGSLLLALAAGLLSGCRPQPETAPEIALTLTAAPHPPVVGPVALSLTLTDGTNGRPVSGAAVRLEVNMSHPGMQPVFATAREVEPGRYEAPLELTMGGDWIVLVDATLRDGRALRRQVSLPGVRAKAAP